MTPTPLPQTPRARRRGPVLLVVASTLLALGLGAAAHGVPVAPTGPDGALKVRTGRLVEAGPTAEHGFPAWYRDSNGVRLEACTTLDDPLCSTLPDEVPDPDAPVSYPDNFPGEFFYQLAGAELTGGGVDMSVGLDLEGAWANEEVVDGDQMVFGRIRIRDRGLDDGEYRVTHPYGTDVFTVAGDGINYTQDIGTTPGAFGQALTSRVGPFLTWDPAVAPAAPEGYVGDPGVPHQVVGSPYGTDYVSVERHEPDGGWTELARTDLFSLQGRKASNAGVDVRAATYSVGADGTGFVDVYAGSDSGQSIHVLDSGLGFVETGLEGDGRGSYYGRFAIDREPDGRSVVVANTGDRPAAQKQLRLSDVVTVERATYDADADELTVLARSSDQDSSPAHLTVAGQALVDGVATISTVVPTPTVTVVSDKGGSATVPVTVAGRGFQADPPVAAAFASPTDAAPGQRVTLTGTGSSGTITSYTWRQVPGTAQEDVEVTLPDGTTETRPSTVEVPVTDDNRVDLVGAGTAVASFVAPTGWTGPLAFELVVEGPAGTSEPAVVPVTVVAPDPTQPLEPSAVAGEDRTARRGTTVRLDGTGSTRADSYAWTQVSGPAVSLVGATSATPSFTMPLMPLPTSTTTTNPSYQATAAPVVLRLTVTSVSGLTASDDVVVAPTPEVLSVTAAELRGNDWRVSGTSNVLAGQRVTVVLGSTLQGRVVGFTTVDAAGAWSYRAASTAAVPTTTTTVSAVSAQGGSATGFVFRRR